MLVPCLLCVLPVRVDIRDLISVDDAMEELALGPNGALVYCMEYLMENLEWLDDQIGEFDSDYLVIDCPGQIELYTHLPVIPRVVDLLQQRGYQVCAVYCVDATAPADASRFIGSAMAALACMVHLKVAHINVLTKTDLLPSRHTARRLCDSDPSDLLAALNQDTGDRFTALNAALAQLLEDFNMVGFLPMTATKPSSVTAVLGAADFALQYGEDEEPREPKDEPTEE